MKTGISLFSINNSMVANEIGTDAERAWAAWTGIDIYHQTSNISRTSVGNKIVDHSDVVGASPVGTAPTTSSFLP